jgi:dTDP-4-amino-4,6-dideoxygalactose transaminase
MSLSFSASRRYLSVAKHAVYQERFRCRPEDWPVAHRVGRQIVSLPLTPKLSNTEINRVIRAVYGVLRVL